MLKKLINKINRNQKGITGLETAIILIAFVVVASVFAYTVLSAGIFSAQKGKEAVYAGLDEARASLEPKGGMTAYGTTIGTTDTAGKVSFTVANALAGQAIDLTPSYVLDAGALEANTADHVALISYIDDTQMITDTAWTVEFIGKHSADNLLESGEQAVITVWLLDFDDPDYDVGEDADDPFIDLEASLPGIYDTFTVEVKGAKGAALTMERSLPARIDTVMDLK
jgi:flagellin FlaB